MTAPIHEHGDQPASYPRGRALGIVGTALGLSAFLAATVLAASTNFIEPNSSPEAAGEQPISVAAADFDGDADQDVATANQFSDDVTILLNNGGGDFAEPATSPEAAGWFPGSVAAADLDGDTDQDLAVANQLDDNVTILRNNGAGDFPQPVTSPEAVGSAPESVAAADLDGDGDQDLATANAESDDVTILRNNGAGNFAEPASSPVAAGSLPQRVAAADLDGDTDQDLAVANYLSNQVTILRNNGVGNFAQPASSPEPGGHRPWWVAAADLDVDGDQDLAVANRRPGTVTILLNNGAGNFVRPASSPETVGSNPDEIAAADFDGDTDPDLAVTNQSDDNVTILRNNGAANFFQPASSPERVGDSPDSVAAADLDGDADPDLAVSNQVSYNVTILLNR